MSILPCIQFHASYDEESYNEYKFIYMIYTLLYRESMC